MTFGSTIEPHRIAHYSRRRDYATLNGHNQVVLIGKFFNFKKFSLGYVSLSVCLYNSLAISLFLTFSLPFSFFLSCYPHLLHPFLFTPCPSSWTKGEMFTNAKRSLDLVHNFANTGPQWTACLLLVTKSRRTIESIKDSKKSEIFYLRSRT